MYFRILYMWNKRGIKKYKLHCKDQIAPYRLIDPIKTQKYDLMSVFK